MASKRIQVELFSQSDEDTTLLEKTLSKPTIVDVELISSVDENTPLLEKTSSHPSKMESEAIPLLKKTSAQPSKMEAELIPSEDEAIPLLKKTSSQPSKMEAELTSPIDEDTSLLKKTLPGPSPCKKSKIDVLTQPEVSDAEVVASMFCDKWSALNNQKPSCLIADLEIGVLYDVNFIRHYTYRSGEEIVQNIQIDLLNYVLLPPFRVRNFLLREIFGCDENGKKLPSKGIAFKQYIKDDTLHLLGMVMVVNKVESNGKSYLNCNFVMKQ